MRELPDSTKVWRPPAATVDIHTPGPKVTRQGDAKKVSSSDIEEGGSCLTDDVLLLLILPSPDFLLSTQDSIPLVVFVLSGFGPSVLSSGFTTLVFAKLKKF